MTRDQTGRHARFDRMLRYAGLAGVVWATFQILSQLANDWPGAIQLRPLLVNVLPVLILTIGTMRRSILAGGLLGLYGLYRLAMSSIVLSRALGGTADQYFKALHWEMGVVMLVAAFWMSGGLAAVQLGRRRHP